MQRAASPDAACRVARRNVPRKAMRHAAFLTPSAGPDFHPIGLIGLMSLIGLISPKLYCWYNSGQSYILRQSMGRVVPCFGIMAIIIDVLLAHEEENRYFCVVQHMLWK